MELKKELLSIKLGDLLPSARNVRRHAPGEVQTLAALIASQGLLHPLIVTERLGGRGASRRLRFEVVAGERRRRALLLLQVEGRLPADHEVPCELVPPERALEISVAENSGREALHPADEFEAFKAMVDEGRGIEDVAVRFGVTPLTVQRRLKLSALSPRLLALYREDGINLDQLMALALSDEHAVQEMAWFEAQPWEREPAAIRRRLSAGEVEAATSALARFVGIEAYEAAGGVVRRDLFDDAQSRFLSDPALLERLAAEKLEAHAATIRADATEGWKWVEARLSLDHQGLRAFVPCEHRPRRPNQEEAAALAELTQRDQELDAEEEALMDSGEATGDDWERIGLEQEEIEARRKAIQLGLRTWSEGQRRRAGVIVTVSRTGDLEVIRGLMRPEDRKPAADEGRPADEAVHDRGDGAGRAASANTPAGGSPERREAALPESLARRLAAHRTMALQASLLRQVPVALAVLTHAIVNRAFGDDYRRPPSVVQVTPQFSGNALKAAADDLEGSAAWQAVEAAKQAWAARVPTAPGDRLGWLIALSSEELLELLSLCIALTVNVLPGAGAAFEANGLADAVGLDMADWWEPTAASYLNHVPKVQIVQALKETGPGLTDGGVESMKKEALVACAAARLAGKRWLPVPLRKSTA
ncbi:MAG TPA: ParB/RepB/Spo0J family partition protein [Methylibium sp.]|nr:ParB/RepB/Spo0J family partition protein [Methylibium sp.]